MKDKTLNEHLPDFLGYLKTELNHSPKTIAAYSHDLNRLFSYLESAGVNSAAKKISAQHLRDFLASLSGSGPHDRRRKISSLKMFFAFIKKQRIADNIKKYGESFNKHHHIPEDPTLDLDSPKIPDHLPVYLSEPNLHRLLDHPDRTTAMGCCDYLLINLFAHLGLRVSELVGINLSDLDFSAHTILITGKGNKQRLLPLLPDLLEVIYEYLNIRPTSDTPALLLNDSGHRLTPWTAWDRIKKQCAAIGLPKNISPHKLRHTCATLWHGKNISILDIQALLGHSSIATTQIYTHTDTQKLYNALEKLNPLPERNKVA